MFQKLNELSKTNLTQSSNMVESKLITMSAQTSSTIETLQRTVHEQESKLNRFQIALRKHQLAVNELQKALELQKDYSSQLRKKLHDYQDRQVLSKQKSHLVSENDRLKSEIAALRKTIERNSSEPESDQDQNRPSEQIRISRSSDDAEEIDGIIGNLEKQIRQLRKQFHIKEAQIRQQYMLKQQDTKQKLQKILGVLDSFEFLFLNSQNTEEALLEEIQYLKRRLK